MFENFYIKCDYDKMNIIWIILVKIIFRYIIIKKDISYILYS